MGGNTKILKNATSKEVAQVVNTESHQKWSNRVTSAEVRVFRIENANITNNWKLGKKSKQKSTENSIALKNEVEDMNNLDLTWIFLSLLKDERNVTVRNPITPPNLRVDSTSSLNHSNAQVLEEEPSVVTSQDKKFTS